MKNTLQILTYSVLPLDLDPDAGKKNSWFSFNLPVVEQNIVDTEE